MNKCYCIVTPLVKKGFVEVSKEEYDAFNGSEEARPYVGEVYQGAISISEVPEELRTEVQATVDERIKRLGLYKDQTISSRELQQMIDAVM